MDKLEIKNEVLKIMWHMHINVTQTKNNKGYEYGYVRNPQLMYTLSHFAAFYSLDDNEKQKIMQEVSEKIWWLRKDDASELEYFV